jgi:hypothetical protein
MNDDLLVVGIKGSYRPPHPLPKLKNFIVTDWEDKKTISKADIFVQTNIDSKDKKLDQQYDFIKHSRKPWLVTESAVFRRNLKNYNHPSAYHRWSWLSYFRNEGNYNNSDCPSDRWLRLQNEQNIEIKDWKKNGNYILFLMQRPGDTSNRDMLREYSTYQNFLQETLNNIRSFTDRPIILRMHPLRMDAQKEILKHVDLSQTCFSENLNERSDNRLDGGAGLYEDFKNAWAVVGWNSNALTESICEGIPTFSLHPSSMAWECSNKNLKNLENPEYFDRNQWLYNLAYCQWTEEEIERGDPWFHLKDIHHHIKRKIDRIPDNFNY